ncbi:hypothetical protein BSKO_12728 [Bryopsis sp. KO-2023]|nr:hypothetical protein BSKO_12728 [Bryopsis sp. KO-2023]
MAATPGQVFKSLEFESNVRGWLKNRAARDEVDRVVAVLDKISKKVSAKSRPISAAVVDLVFFAVSRDGASGNRSTTCGQEQELLDISGATFTSYQKAFGMRDSNPDIYSIAVNAGRARPMPNLTYKSSWGDTLKSASGRLSERNNKTTYQRFNEEVFNKPTETMITKTKGFLNWFKRNQLYYGDLVPQSVATCIDSLLENSDISEQQEVMEVFEKLHAVLAPNRNKSTSHTYHCGFKSLGDGSRKPVKKAWDTSKRPPTAKNTKDQNSTIKNTEAAHPKQEPVESSCGDRSSRKSGPDSRRSRTHTTTSSENTSEIETFKSSVPLKWMGYVRKPDTTAYRQSFCRDPSEPIQKNTQENGVEERNEITMGFGNVLPHQNRSARRGFPVREAFVRKSQMPGDPKYNRADTTSRSHFLPRSRKETMRCTKSVGQAMERIRAERGASGVRLGVNPPDWRTVYMSEFKEHDIDTESNELTRKAMRAMVGRPTGPVGALAPKKTVAV